MRELFSFVVLCQIYVGATRFDQPKGTARNDPAGACSSRAQDSGPAQRDQRVSVSGCSRRRKSARLAVLADCAVYGHADIIV